MSSFKVLTFFTLLLIAVSCENENRKQMRDEHMKIHKECSALHGFTKEMEMKLKLDDVGQKIKPEDYPKEYLCKKKCVDERFGLLQDGKYDIEKIKKNRHTMMSLITPEAYFKCLEQIDGIKNCDDVKKKVKCDQEAGSTHMSVCTHKFPQQSTGNGKMTRDKNNNCFEKCMIESKGILNKDGKIVVEKAAKDMRTMMRVKDKSAYLDCLKKLEIKTCEDMSKFWECKGNQ